MKKIRPAGPCNGGASEGKTRPAPPRNKRYSGQTNTGVARGGIRKNMHTRQPPTRYGHQEDPSSTAIAEEPADDQATECEEMEPSIP